MSENENAAAPATETTGDAPTAADAPQAAPEAEAAAEAEAEPKAEEVAPEEVAPEEITYHAVEKDGHVTALWEMQGRKHLRTIDPRSRQGQEILRLYTSEHGE